MRDIVVTVIILSSIPFILRAPAVGGLMWVWVSVMNPHTQGWGFAVHFPFAAIIAGVTVFSLMVTRTPQHLPLTPVTWTLLALVLWMNITTPLAILPMASYGQWNKVMKIMLMTFVVMAVIRSRKDLHRLIWVLVIALGYYGVKGGIFTIRSGGQDRVWGPEGTFIGDNNAIALALIMLIPLAFYVQQYSGNKWVRHGLTMTMLLSALAALGSYSRGALLAIGAMVLFMWIKSGKKIAVGTLVLLVAPLFLVFMPQRWSERMDTIGAYQQDSSAQGRINAWRMAYNLASDRFFGGGFELADPAIFLRYAPDPDDIHAAHSIYFQVLGEHGFVGLTLYLLLGLLTWRSATWVIRHATPEPELLWAVRLVMMIQASLIGFAVGGAFLSLLYFDVPYYLMGAVVATRVLVEQTLRHTTGPVDSAGTSPALPRPVGTVRPALPTLPPTLQGKP